MKIREKEKKDFMVYLAADSKVKALRDILKWLFQTLKQINSSQWTIYESASSITPLCKFQRLALLIAFSLSNSKWFPPSSLQGNKFGFHFIN